MKILILSASTALAFAASLVNVGPLSTPATWRTSHYENVLGTSMEIKLGTTSETAATRAEEAAMAEIRRLNGILSGYDSSSEFSTWSRTRGAAVHVSPELMDVLSLWDAWKARTSGALNPAAEAVIRVWKPAIRKMPMQVSAHVATSAITSEIGRLKKGNKVCV